jgi:superfamily II helicase
VSQAVPQDKELPQQLRRPSRAASRLFQRRAGEKSIHRKRKMYSIRGGVVRTCIKCNQEKDESEFNDQEFYKINRCKECVNKHRREVRKSTRPKAKKKAELLSEIKRLTLENKELRKKLAHYEERWI